MLTAERAWTLTMKQPDEDFAELGDDEPTLPGGQTRPEAKADADTKDAAALAPTRRRAPTAARHAAVPEPIADTPSRPELIMDLRFVALEPTPAKPAPNPTPLSTTRAGRKTLPPTPVEPRLKRRPDETE